MGGVVTNWTLVSLNHGLQSCMDPNVMEAQVRARVLLFVCMCVYAYLYSLSCMDPNVVEAQMRAWVLWEGEGEMSPSSRKGSAHYVLFALPL